MIGVLTTPSTGKVGVALRRVHFFLCPVQLCYCWCNIYILSKGIVITGILVIAIGNSYHRDAKLFGMHECDFGMAIGSVIRTDYMYISYL